MNTLTVIVIIIIIVVVLFLLGSVGPNSSQMGGKKGTNFKKIFFCAIGIIFLFLILKKLKELSINEYMS